MSQLITTPIDPVARPIGVSVDPMLAKVRDARSDLENAVAKLEGHKPRSIEAERELKVEILNIAREAAGHLDEALRLDAPADAVIETRYALTWLRKHIDVVDNPKPGVSPMPLDPLQFQDTINRLREVERQLDQRGFVGQI